MYCAVDHKNLYHAKSANINFCFSDTKTFGSSCNWSYFGLVLSRRSGIKCCNIHIQGKRCSLCSNDNVCLTCISLFGFLCILYFIYFFSRLFWLLFGDFCTQFCYLHFSCLLSLKEETEQKPKPDLIQVDFD